MINEEMKRKTSNNEFGKRKAGSARVRAKNNIGRNTIAWSGRPEVKLTGVPVLPRWIDLVDVCWSLRALQDPERKMTTEALRKDLWVDLSQGVARKPLKIKPHLFRTTTYNYSYEMDKVLTRKEHMILMGWPGHALEGFPDSKLRKLVGECYSLPIATVLDHILYCNPWGEWWHQ